MKNLFFILIFFSALTWVNAQEEAAGSANSTKNINFERWSQDLDLTDSQKAQILEIKSKYSNQITESRKSGMKRDAQKDLWFKQEEEIKKILTAEQLEKANSLEQKNKGKKENRFSNSTNK